MARKAKVRRIKAQVSETPKIQYSRSTDFFKQNRDSSKSAGLSSLRTPKQFNISNLPYGLKFSDYQIELVRLYNAYNRSLNPENYSKAIDIVKKCVEFYHSKISRTIVLRASEMIVFCNPYFDAISGQLIYKQTKPTKPPVSNEVGITHTVDDQKSGVAGSPYIIGLNWDLIDKTDNNYHELRDVVLHELAHAHMYMEGKCDERYEVYERHTEEFCEQIAIISEVIYKETNKEFLFTNTGPHHPFVKIGDLNIEFIPSQPKLCRSAIKDYFRIWNEAFDLEEQRRSESRKNRKRTSGRKGEQSAKRKR